MEPAPVLTTLEAGVGTLCLNRPEKFNCLSMAVHSGVDAALDDLTARGARVILLRAAGRHFCTGADLEEVQQLRAAGRFGEFIDFGHRVLRRLETSELPVIGVVQGLCLAGGLELMLACDLIIAGASARFGDQHAQYGLVPGWGGSQRLPRLVGRRRALDLMFTARWLDAPTALDWGLVNQVVDDDELHRVAQDIAAAMARRSVVGLGAMKTLVNRGEDLPLDEALALEARLAAEAMTHADVDEGLAAFAARRPPHFDGAAKS